MKSVYYYEWFISFVWVGFGILSLYEREVTNMLVCFALSKLSMIRVESALLKERLDV